MRLLLCLFFLCHVLADDSCPSGRFTSQGECCDLCPKGHGIIEECCTINTQCQSCEDDKNSSLLRGPKVEPVMDDAKLMTSGEPETSTAMGAVNFTAYDTGKNIIPVYCSILAAVIVGLVIYVTVKCWNTCKQKKQLAKARAGELNAGPEGEKLHSDSGVFVDTHSLHEPQLSKAARVDTPLYSKLPPQKREEVEQLLSGPGANRSDWHNLARLLGYDEERAATIGRGEDPAHTLLSDWSMRDGASLDVLCKALGRMERDDIVERLLSETAVTSVV
ncbi:tumor necrosis factor receptor superfamily member 16-like [Heptranchias perlo]|uniref:tumor necrosis factor receptor superfamily member 16-like n=1 Tax=Heptranchias perlo TaxID=212740 RepID=UPI00355A5E7C